MATCRLAITALLAASLAAGCSKDRPGNPEVYERIARTTDCAQLQHEFDTAEANQKRDLARGAVDQAEASTAYMDAADKRMREVGCY
jgi:outer membrane PBP1 activator LpoA protein